MMDPIYYVNISADFVRVKSWIGVHRLRISALCMCHNDGMLGSISFDCSFKVLNAATGKSIWCIVSYIANVSLECAFDVFVTSDIIMNKLISTL